MDTRTLTGFSGFDGRYACTTADGRPLVIRLAVPADRQTIVANVNAVCAEQVYLQSDCFVLTPDWEAILNGRDAAATRRLLLVAEVKGQIVGHGRIFPWGFGHKDRHVADVGIAVLESYREARVGTQMLGCLVAWSRLAGYEKLTAAVLADNRRALNLFARFGFVQEGVRERQFRIQDRYVGEILLGRFLSDEITDE